METISENMRIESDLIGSMEVPADALYGVQTLRGIENFPISCFHLTKSIPGISKIHCTKSSLVSYTLQNTF